MISVLSENRRIGICLCCFGIFLYSGGLLLLFDRLLLLLANASFFGGINFILGPYATSRFFLKRTKLKGSFFCLTGFIFILYRWGSIGFFFQLYGIWSLFRAVLPNILASLKLTPFGVIFQLPGLATIADWIYDQRRLPI